MSDRTATIQSVRRIDGRTEYVVEVFALKPVSIAVGAFLTREAAEKFAAASGAAIKEGVT